MELFFAVIILLAARSHRQGFSSFESKGAKEIFLLNQCSESEIFINGFPTGVKEAGLLYIDPQLEFLNIQLVKRVQILYDFQVNLVDHKTLIQMPQAGISLRFVQ